MEQLFQTSELYLKTVSNYTFKRFLYGMIKEAKSRLIGIIGARGVGKTVLMLQILRELDLPPTKAIYISLEDPYFAENKFLDFAKNYSQTGGQIIFADEIHRYPNWTQELKIVYDLLPQMRVVFSGSSALEIFKAVPDLARRMVLFDLPVLSLREFIALNQGINLQTIDLQDILTNHVKIAREYITKFLPIKALKDYYRFGAYPFSLEDEDFYLQRLKQSINLVLELDLPSIEKLNYFTTYKLKKLVRILAESSPFKPNISKLAEQLETSRDKVLRFLHLLEISRIINLLRTDQVGNAYLRKPEKILLANPNLLYAFADVPPQMGSLRESFFVSQISAVHKIFASKQVDYKVNGYSFEIGGKNKTKKQISDLDDAFIVADDMEVGYDNKIPLWLLGFLY